MTYHDLKTWPEYYELARTGKKTFEIRPDDRTPRFAEGDRLILSEWDPGSDRYTGRLLVVDVKLVVRGEPIVPKGYCVMQIERA